MTSAPNCTVTAVPKNRYKMKSDNFIIKVLRMGPWLTDWRSHRSE